MAIMKQIDECLTRAFEKKDPLPRKKWKGFLHYDEEIQATIIVLYHYHHLVLVHNCDTHESLYEWWEKQADKRGLESAKEWLHMQQQKHIETRTLSIT